MFQRVGAAAYKKDLTNTLALCEMLGDPHRQIKAIHIAGTNGKGSVSHLLTAMLMAAGYKTGLYISPHYRDFRERIKINGEYISEEEVVRFVEKYQQQYLKIKPSFFELTVAMAFEHFVNHQVDIAVIETGMGGRFDSTNVITPLLSVITNIGYDHMQFLGNTLPEIAFEKAGIIKPHVPVVIGEADPVTAPVFFKSAMEKESFIEFADHHVRMEVLDKTPEGMLFNIVENEVTTHRECFTQLYGDFQLKNLATAWFSAKQLNASGIPVSEKHILEGMKRVKELTHLIGRWEFLSKASPVIIADSGHNSHGLKVTLKELLQLKAQRLHFVIGFVNDKDLSATLPLFPSNANYYFCKPDIPRGMDAIALKKQSAAYGLLGEAFSSVREALEVARLNATEQDVIFIGGSTFVVAEVV